MNAVLVRVGADQSTGDGGWNGPVGRTLNRAAVTAVPLP